MKKRKMMGLSMMSFRDGCQAYLQHCRQRNLREAIIRHYRQSNRPCPAYAAGTLNVNEPARVCGLSKPTVSKYLRLVG